MAVNNLYSGIGLLACVGALILIALVAIASLVISRPRHHNERENMYRPPGPERPTRSDTPTPTPDDFGGVPTTGPVQDYERDYNPEMIIGSSGFGGAQDTPRVEDQEEEDQDLDDNGESSPSG